MYYITNQDKQVIAADSSLIKLLNVKDINELYKEILLKNIQILPLGNDRVTIKTALNQQIFDTKLHIFSSLLGDFYLTEILKTDTDKNSPIITSKESTLNEEENKAITNLQLLKNRLASEKNSIIEEKSLSETIETISMPLEDDLLDDALFLDTLKTKEEVEEKTTVEDTNLDEDSISINNTSSRREELLLDTAKPENTSIEDTLPQEDLLDDALFLEKLEKKEELKAETTVEDNISLDDTISLEEELLLNTPENETISLEDTSAQESLLDDALFLEELEKKEEELLVDIPETTPMPLDDDLFNDDLFAEKIEEKEELAPKPIPLDDDLFNDDLFTEKIEKKEVEVKSSMSVPPIGESLNNDDDILNLILNDEPEITLESITKTSDDPIHIDIKSISNSIGISEEDYGLFLDEYIQTARSFENDLQNSGDEKRNDTLNTLTHLSNVLQLPIIAKSITQIKEGTNDSLDSNIKSFYSMLTKLSQSLEEISKSKEKSVPEKREETSPSIDELILDEPVTVEKPIVIDEAVALDESIVINEPAEIEEPIEEVINPNSFGSISLEGIDPIHFDFQMEQAATDLGLPVDLIEEFVDDFIVQAHEETLKMLKCYEEGDLDTIQKIGHLLKGTSSNLRIAPLADTLYEIQFCEDSSKLEKLIKFYWAHFLSLETQVKLTKK